MSSPDGVDADDTYSSVRDGSDRANRPATPVAINESGTPSMVSDLRPSVSNVASTSMPTATTAGHSHGSTMVSIQDLQTVIWQQAEQIAALHALVEAITVIQPMQLAPPIPTPIRISPPPTPPVQLALEAATAINERLLLQLQTTSINEQRREERNVEREERKRNPTTEAATATDIARAAAACPHDGNVENGQQWGEGMRGLVRRISPAAAEIVKLQTQPPACMDDENRLLYEVIVASINVKIADGAALMRMIR